jgi:D-alanine--poly(phosphoribitol) ligase subunit 1
MKALSYEYNLGQYFSRVAHENPMSVAIKTTNNDFITYQELEVLSNKIAHFIANSGVHKNDVITILNNKTFSSYAIMIACFKIGVIYTNLDPKSPVERFNKMLDVCSPKFLFHAGNEHFDVISRIKSADVLLIDYTSEQFLSELSKQQVEMPRLNTDVTSSNPAYIMFTSGSTGFPKGVVISQGSLIHFINWSRSTYNITTNDVFTNLNPMHFDNSVFDFYASLFNGASLLPITEELTINPRKLLDALNVLKPTIWFSVPSMLVYVLNMRALKDIDLPTLRIVTFGGEGFPKNKLRELWDKWKNRISFVNVYGPTEGTCICSSYLVTEQDLLNDELLPLGPIAPNFTATVLNEMNQVITDDGIGELCIGGPNLALGYYNNPTKTSEVFVDHPRIHSHSEKIYRTGDLVSYEKNMNVFLFRGRKDNQIKRMGYRIELEEIENAFNTLDYIEESAVIYVDNANYKAKIIACIKSKELNEERIRDAISKHLPQYMLPDLIFHYDILPKNANGKIDRLALKARYI